MGASKRLTHTHFHKSWKYLLFFLCSEDVAQMSIKYYYILLYHLDDGFTRHVSVWKIERHHIYSSFQIQFNRMKTAYMHKTKWIGNIENDLAEIGTRNKWKSRAHIRADWR